LEEEELGSMPKISTTSEEEDLGSMRPGSEQFGGGGPGIHARDLCNVWGGGPGIHAWDLCHVRGGGPGINARDLQQRNDGGEWRRTRVSYPGSATGSMQGEEQKSVVKKEICLMAMIVIFYTRKLKNNL
jgi:hypothetical protein